MRLSYDNLFIFLINFNLISIETSFDVLQIFINFFVCNWMHFTVYIIYNMNMNIFMSYMLRDNVLHKWCKSSD